MEREPMAGGLVGAARVGQWVGRDPGRDRDEVGATGGPPGFEESASGCQAAWMAAKPMTARAECCSGRPPSSRRLTVCGPWIVDAKPVIWSAER